MTATWKSAGAGPHGVEALDVLQFGKGVARHGHAGGFGSQSGQAWTGVKRVCFKPRGLEGASVSAGATACVEDGRPRCQVTHEQLARRRHVDVKRARAVGLRGAVVVVVGSSKEVGGVQ